MLRTLVLAAAALVVATPALAAPCRDTKGHFIKCPPAKAAPAARCRDAKGKFMACAKK